MRRRVILAHELGHLFGPPSITLALASRATLARVDASAWVADKGALSGWAVDEDVETLCACHESTIFEGSGVWTNSDLFDAAKADAVADQFALQTPHGA